MSPRENISRGLNENRKSIHPQHLEKTSLGTKTTSLYKINILKAGLHDSINNSFMSAFYDWV
jgi:hypothetical protein